MVHFKRHSRRKREILTFNFDTSWQAKLTATDNATNKKTSMIHTSFFTFLDIFRSKVLFSILLVLFASCKSTDTTRQKIADGSYCYHSTDDKSLFLQLEFSGKKLKGRIQLEEEVSGKVFYDFSGIILNDSTLNVEIHFYEDDIPGQWLIRYTEEGVVLKNFFIEELTDFISIDCEKTPELSEYYSVEEIAREEDAEFSENDYREGLTH